MIYSISFSVVQIIKQYETQSMSTGLNIKYLKLIRITNIYEKKLNKREKMYIKIIKINENVYRITKDRRYGAIIRNRFRYKSFE